MKAGNDLTDGIVSSIYTVHKTEKQAYKYMCTYVYASLYVESDLNVLYFGYRKYTLTKMYHFPLGVRIVRFSLVCTHICN